MPPDLTPAERTYVNMAIGRLLRIMGRPYQAGDIEQFEGCRRVVLDTLGDKPPYTPNYARDRLKGAQGDA